MILRFRFISPYIRIIAFTFLLIGLIAITNRILFLYFGAGALDLIKIVIEEPPKINLADLKATCFNTIKVGQCPNKDYQIYGTSSVLPYKVYDDTGQLIYTSFIGSTTYTRLYIFRKIQQTEIGCDRLLMTDLCK